MLNARSVKKRVQFLISSERMFSFIAKCHYQERAKISTTIRNESHRKQFFLTII